MGDQAHGADASSEWIAVVVEPDYCKVGTTTTMFDTTSRLNSWAPMNPENKLRARSHMVYLDQDKIEGVQGNAGNGVVSLVSLDNGYVLITEPYPRTRVLVMGRAMAHDGTRCYINANAGGAGGAEGVVQTKQKGDDGMRADQLADHILEKGDAAAQAERARNQRYMPRKANSNNYMNPRQAAKTGRADYVLERNFSAKPGQAGYIKGLKRISDVAGPAGDVVGGVVSGHDRWLKDAATRPELTTTERAARAYGQGGANVTGSIAGAWAGAKAGAFIGAWFGPVGALVGGVAGGVAGAYFGGDAGDYYMDKVLDKPY